MAPFRLIVAGLVHDHAWNMLPQFTRIPGVKIVGGADPNRPLREKLRKQFGVSALYAFSHLHKRLFPNSKGESLHYAHAADPTGGVVTFASLAFR